MTIIFSVRSSDLTLKIVNGKEKGKQKTYRGGGIAPPFLISALDEGEWASSPPCRFTLGETTTIPIG
jgi:hypothetical protein